MQKVTVSAPLSSEPPDGVAEDDPRSNVDAPAHSSSRALFLLFVLAQTVPWLLALIRPIVVRITVLVAPEMANDIAANAQRIFGRVLPKSERRRFAVRVVDHFYRFVTDLGQIARRPEQDLTAKVEQIEGEPQFLASRRAGKGAILLTAHMGSFEVGLAALRRVEHDVHVLFKRDAFEGFERIRKRVREVLGVHEAPIDDGIASLIKLRDALQADQIVVMQGDRAMPGQKSMLVPFCSGHLRLPLGPVKMAQLTGSPIVPVFVVRGNRGGFCVHLENPIWLDASNETSSTEKAMLSIARAIESFVRQYPEQWLMLGRAFADDEGSAHAR